MTNEDLVLAPVLMAPAETLGKGHMVPTPSSGPSQSPPGELNGAPAHMTPCGHSRGQRGAHLPTPKVGGESRVEGRHSPLGLSTESPGNSSVHGLEAA